MPKEEDGILHFIIFKINLIIDFITKGLSLTCFAFFLRGWVGGNVS